jgi:8-amino-7-oxononanoate synthase
VLGTRKLRAKIIATGRLFAGATPVPLPLASAALVSLRLLATDPGFLERLKRNTARVRNSMRQAGCEAPPTPGPIVALPPMTPREVVALRRRLLQAGIYPPLVRYPGGPANGYFRIVISSEHTEQQLDTLAAALAASSRACQKDSPS